MPHASPTWAVILAAGQGSRLAAASGGVRKQFLDFQGAPLFWRSALVLARSPGIHGLVFVFPPQELEACEQRLRSLDRGAALGLPWRTAPGGDRRQDSVFQGLSALPPGCARVLIHDAARPFVTAGLVARLLDALAQGAPAAIPGLPVTDTIKRVVDGLVADTPERSQLMAVQTPQAFALAPLLDAHRQAQENGWDVTDDAMLAERAGVAVRVVAGEAANIKITNPEDLALLRKEAKAMDYPATGYGYDVHRYAHAAVNAKQPARPMILGGVPIPGGPEVLAHSDGDVLLHALADAVLGCVGLGDIGGLFPDNDPAYDNAASTVLLAQVLDLAARRGLTIQHADLTIIAQAPKIAPHRQAIRDNLARLLELPPRQVNLKATTEEGLGFTGRKEGIKAVALVTGRMRPPPEDAD